MKNRFFISDIPPRYFIRMKDENDILEIESEYYGNFTDYYAQKDVLTDSFSFPIRKAAYEMFNKPPQIFSHYVRPDLQINNEEIVKDFKDKIIFLSYYESEEDGDVISTIIVKLADIRALVVFHNDTIKVYYADLRDTDMIKLFIKSITDEKAKYLRPKPVESSKLSLICKESNGLVLRNFSIAKVDLDLDTHYNDGLKETHKTIMQRLTTPKDKGIVILHGVPGTGKTTYLRYLINQITNKKLIFMPPDLAHELASPGFIPFILNNPNSILVIEDSENIISERKGGQNQAVSNLLNMSDGLLADVLNIQLICTFNADINRIDQALLRKGRLIAKWDFKELEQEKAKKLAESLGVTFEGEATLANIFNAKEKMETKEPRKAVGFKI
jgi:hypothetical protein